jgi:hypothetical protein
MNLRNLKIVWANLEVKALTEDLSYTWLRISAAQFSGYYGNIVTFGCSIDTTRCGHRKGRAMMTLPPR